MHQGTVLVVIRDIVATLKLAQQIAGSRTIAIMRLGAMFRLRGRTARQEPQSPDCEGLNGLGNGGDDVTNVHEQNTQEFGQQAR